MICKYCGIDSDAPFVDDFYDDDDCGCDLPCGRLPRRGDAK